MGQYEPDDSRDVTLRKGHEPGGIERTGPREHETRQQDQGDGRTARGGYGNARDENGQMEQDVATSEVHGGDAFVGEVSNDPTVRAKADANRPLSDD